MTKCTACHTGTYKDKPVLFSARRGDRLLVVEDVPALVCDVCGRSDIHREGLQRHRARPGGRAGLFVAHLPLPQRGGVSVASCEV